MKRGLGFGFRLRSRVRLRVGAVGACRGEPIAAAPSYAAGPGDSGSGVLKCGRQARPGAVARAEGGGDAGHVPGGRCRLGAGWTCMLKGGYIAVALPLHCRYITVTAAGPACPKPVRSATLEAARSSA